MGSVGFNNDLIKLVENKIDRSEMAD